MSHLGQRLSALIDGELGDAERDRVLAHLAGCDACRQDAIALRALKQRMHSLGEAMVDAALTGRLMAVGADGPGPRAPWRSRTGSSAPRLLAAGILASAVAGLGAAAFYAGGEQPVPGPRVTPAVDTFMIQHDNLTGETPVTPASSGPSGAPTAGSAGHPRAGGGPAAGRMAGRGSGGTGPATHPASTRAVRSELVGPATPTASRSTQVTPAVGHVFATPGP
jgi:Putative zinc-finger